MKVHARSHEVGPTKPRMRIWTDEMAKYGQFNVVDFDDFASFVLLIHKLNIGEVQIHRCDGQSDCNCHMMTYGEELSDLV